jgi:RsiW-degrading membrane proteinase PrsW (M82 family)
MAVSMASASMMVRNEIFYFILFYEIECLIHVWELFYKQNNHAAPWSLLVSTFLCG